MVRFATHSLSSSAQDLLHLSQVLSSGPLQPDLVTSAARSLASQSDCADVSLGASMLETPLNSKALGSLAEEISFEGHPQVLS